jgi:arylsulfatase A-like enzyme
MTQPRQRWRFARHLVVVLGLVLGLGSLAPSTQSATRPEPPVAAGPTQPNVVVIMTDDMRVSDLRWMPKTQQLIAGAGARFTNSFAPYPLCCPARASFLSGQYTHNHGVWSHHAPYGFSAFDDTSTLPVWLQEAGYRTLFLGKYLNGYGKQPTPDGQPSTLYVPPGWSDWRGAVDGSGLPPDDPLEGGTYRYWDTTLNVNGQLEPHPGEYQTKMLGRQSVSLIQAYAPASEPFFLWASYVAPHHGRPGEDDDPPPVPRDDGKTTHIVTPAVPAEARGRFDDVIVKPDGLPSEGDVSDKPAFIRRLPPINELEEAAMLEAARQRAEAVSVVDDQVADTIEALRDTGELDNTLVMFTSDNGYFQGEHRMRQGKTLPYEPSLSTPLLIRGPGIPQGVTRSSPFLSIDFAPTILEAAGAPLPASIDGQPRLGVARNGGDGWKRPVLTETGPRGTVTGAGDAGPPLEAKPAADDKPYSVGVRVARFLYVEHLSDERELYDMRRDPGQRRNVVDHEAYDKERQRLAKILQDLRTCAGDECRRKLSSW